MTNMNRINKLAALMLLVAVAAFGQIATTQTTLSVAIPTPSSGNGPQVCLASATGVVLPSLSGNTVGSILVMDKEAFQVMTQGTSSTCFGVRRGVLGSLATGHVAGQTVWVGSAAVGSGDNSHPFTGAISATAPSGSCTRTLQYSLPIIITGGPAGLNRGDTADCIDGNWVVGIGQPYYQKPFTAFTTPQTAYVAGNSTAGVAGTTFFGQIFIPTNATLTGACVLNGATVTSSNVIYALYDDTGALVANTALAGTVTAGVSIYQCIAFTATVQVKGPLSYFLAVQTSGTNTIQTYAAGGAPTNYGTNSFTGTFGTLVNPITPTVTFAANKGPIGMVY